MIPNPCTYLTTQLYGYMYIILLCSCESFLCEREGRILFLSHLELHYKTTKLLAKNLLSFFFPLFPLSTFRNLLCCRSSFGAVLTALYSTSTYVHTYQPPIVGQKIIPKFQTQKGSSSDYLTGRKNIRVWGYMSKTGNRYDSSLSYDS